MEATAVNCRNVLSLAVIIIHCLYANPRASTAMEILAKSRLERCTNSGSPDGLDCRNKVVLDVAVPSGSSGGEAGIVAQLVEVEDNNTQKIRAIRTPPIITINKSAAYALYELSYIRDVAYKPEEFYVKTRRCEPDAGAKIVEICEGLRDQDGHIIEHTQPICCPCGPHRRVPSSCGNFFGNIGKGKKNTAHCLRFPGDWFHVFGIGRRSLGFSVRINVEKGSSKSEVTVGPENRTVLSDDSFLRVNLIGDFVGYTSIPSFEDFYLVIPRLASAGQPEKLGTNFSKWMLLERMRFTLDGLECNKIGVSYEAYNGQPDFCSSPLWSCLHNQLWNFWEADQNRITRTQQPQYIVEGRFERINQHPNAGTHSFSVGITEVLYSNLLIELSADDIEYVYQRSPGKILSINIPTFEALTQFGVATVSTKNIGNLEASYSLTFDCLRGVNYVEEQFFVMKPEESVSRAFYLHPATDQAAKYECAAILKDSDFREVDRAECQFTTTATVLDNGSQIITDDSSKADGIEGFFASLKNMWKIMWGGLIDFFTGKTCRTKCTSFFEFGCHMQYICVSWILLFILLLAILPTVVVLLWLLHQKGFFDPFWDWWDDRFGAAIGRDKIYSSRARGRKHKHDYFDNGYPRTHDRERKHQLHQHKKRKSRHDPHIHHRHKHPDLSPSGHQYYNDDIYLGVHKGTRKRHGRKLSMSSEGHHDHNRNF